MSTIKYLLDLKLLFLFDIAFDIAGLSLLHLAWNVIFKIWPYLFVCFYSPFVGIPCVVFLLLLFCMCFCIPHVLNCLLISTVLGCNISQARCYLRGRCS